MVSNLFKWLIIYLLTNMFIGHNRQAKPRRWIAVPNEEGILIRVVCIDKPKDMKKFNLQQAMGLDQDTSFYEAINVSAFRTLLLFFRLYISANSALSAPKLRHAVNLAHPFAGVSKTA